jgi:hypothetical protein
MPADTGTLYWLRVILNHPDLDPTETLLLIALADHVDADDRCWVGIQRLASWSRTSYSTARRRLAVLETRGYITRVRRHRDDGGDSVYDYTLLRAALDPGQDVTPPAQNGRAPRSPRWAGPPAHPGERAEVPLPNHTPNARPGASQMRAVQPTRYVPDLTPGEPMPTNIREGLTTSGKVRAWN